MRHAVLAATLLSFSATAAFAADDWEFRPVSVPDGNVVELDISHVALPPRLPGVCAVAATVGKVWFGRTFHAGQPLSLAVPCDATRLLNAALPAGEIVPVDAALLGRSRRAIARLDDNGRIMWQPGPYGQSGAVWGYRVLDGRFTPLTPA